MLIYINDKGDNFMNERLKKIRKSLHLSQEFVAKQMGMTRTTIVAVESGNRRISAEELGKFSELYGVTMETLIYGTNDLDSEMKLLYRKLANLSENDKKEILFLIKFKEQLQKKQKQAYNK